MSKGNKETIKVCIMLVIFISIITSIFFFYKSYEEVLYNDSSLLNKIVDKTWYGSTNRNTYESIKFSSDKIVTYVYYDHKDNIGRFNGCESFLYSNDDEKVKLLCENRTKTATISFVDEKELHLNIDDNKYIFYSNMEEE